MLKVNGIYKHLGGQTLLRDVNLTIAPGEVVGLVGMNGSGKTTLLDILKGQTPTDGGEVWIDGYQTIPHNGNLSKDLIFRSYQIPRLFFGLSGVDNLKLGRWSLGYRNALNYDILSGATIERLAETLSTGQRRRLVFDWLYARVKHAKYFLLDEPAAGGDDALIELLLDFLAETRRQGCGVLLVEHRDSVLQDACDRVLYLQDGTCSPEHSSNGCTSAQSNVNRVKGTNYSDCTHLSVRDLVVSRGCTEVLDSIDLEIGMGEIIAVTGSNGCGKSTLLRAIYGDPSCPVTSGTIMSDGVDITKLSLRQRADRGIHFLPQDGTFFASMTVKDALRTSIEALKPEAWDDEATIRIRRNLPVLDRIWQRPCGQLSGGERRLASLARILLLRPNVALLDEPLAGVDSESRQQVIQLVENMAENGAVVVAEQQALVPLLPTTQVISLRSHTSSAGISEQASG